MGKCLFEISEETRDLVDKILGETGLMNYFDTEVIGIMKQKEIVVVKKATETTKFLANKSDTICVYVFEEAFNRLDDKMKDLVMRDALNVISYDSEKDKITITPKGISATVGGYQKYGQELINALEVSSHVIEELAEEEKERKKEMAEIKKKKI